jgi:ribosomal protein S18 acetylase RimI-like enzyme
MNEAVTGVRFRLAVVDDAAALTTFAREIFLATFGPENDPAHIGAYVDKAFTPEMQAQEITRPGTFTLLAVDGAGAIVGYSFVAPGRPERVEVGGAPIEIKRFYVAASHHGAGLAGAMMQEVFERARALGARTIWLGVWERNARAIAFYHKFGFVQAGTQRFLLGDDLQTDWVMQNTTSLR